MPAKPIDPPRLPKTAPLPEPGLYFDMPFETYLAAPAVGSGLLWDVLVDPYMAWARSWMNPLKEELEAEKKADHLLYGQAFHCRILEGPEAYADRFYIEPDKRSYDELLITTDDIKKAIAEFEETPVKGTKPLLIAQLLELWDDAPIWDAIRERAEREAEGRQCIKFDWNTKFEASAAMIEHDPELLELVREGHSEVSLFWHCPHTGLPKKARADKLKMAGICDVKTFANTHEKRLRRAIPQAIANEKYPFQPSHYLEGVQSVKHLIRQAGFDQASLPIFGAVDSHDAERITWAVEWAGRTEPDTWTWLFVQKGDAPIAIGIEYDTEGMLREHFDMFAREASETFAEMIQLHGAEPWIQKHGIMRLEDNMVPAYVMEL